MATRNAQNGRNGKTRELWGRDFRVVKDGLDESDVFSFLGGLIEQNQEFATKLEHVSSLRRLAERAVVQASKEASRIKQEAEDQAKEAAQSIAARGEDQAQSQAAAIIAEAEQGAVDRVSVSEQDARRVLAEAEQAAAALAESLLAEAQQAARDKVESIVAEAEEEAASRAERIVAEAVETARAHAESAAAEVQRDAQSRAEERLTSAEQQASSILEEAHEQSQAAQAPAAAAADELMAEARQSIEAAEKKAHQILTEADEKAASITALAEQEATNFIEELKQKADQAAEARIAKAEEEGRRIIEESIKTARQEAEQITEEAEDGVFGEGLAYGQDDDLRAKFEVLLDLLVSSSFGSRERAQPSARRVAPPPADRPAAITPEAEEPAEDGADLFHGPVQLDFPPPLSSSRVLKIHKALAKMPNLRVLDLEGSSRGGIRIKVYVTGRLPLVDVLREMPEVEKASNGIRPAASRDGGKSPGARRIVVATKS